MTIFFDTEQQIGSFTRSMALRRLGNESMQDWQLSADLQALQSLIAGLQGCEQAYHTRIARQTALGTVVADRPMREIRNTPPPKPNATCRIKALSALGYRIIEQRDYDPATMEIIADE